MARKGKTFMILVVISAAVFALVYFGITLTSNLGKSTGEITAEDADKKLAKLYKEIRWNQAEPVKGQIDLDPADVGDSLPDIAKFPVSVENTTGNYVEIFSSTEKSGTGNDGWLNEVASAFNEANIIVDGTPVSVKIRNIASGTAADYIRSGKYIPDAYTPSNELWGEMVKTGGIQAELVTERLAGNVAGVVTAQKKYDELIAKYGALNVKTITDAISANELSMGYTDPFASSTGLNFLITALGTFDSSDLLSEQAVQGFAKFQSNVPFTASTTLQMRDAAKSGMLDAFVLEYQTFINAADLKSGYVFTRSAFGMTVRFMHSAICPIRNGKFSGNLLISPVRINISSWPRTKASTVWMIMPPSWLRLTALCSPPPRSCGRKRKTGAPRSQPCSLLMYRAAWPESR